MYLRRNLDRIYSRVISPATPFYLLVSDLSQSNVVNYRIEDLVSTPEYILDALVMDTNCAFEIEILDEHLDHDKAVKYANKASNMIPYADLPDYFSWSDEQLFVESVEKYLDTLKDGDVPVRTTDQIKLLLQHRYQYLRTRHLDMSPESQMVVRELKEAYDKL